MANRGRIKWEEKGNYGGYVIIAHRNKRKLIDPKTGETIIQYSI
jgi:hypothetical protein